MNDTQFHHSKSDEQIRFNGTYSPAMEPLLRSLLSTLADIDFEYEKEHERLSKSSPDINLKIRVLEKLKAQHRERRAPYLQQLAILQEKMLVGTP